MVKKNTNIQKNKINKIELAKEIPTSIISVSRQYVLDYTALDPKRLDELYATVPEVSRTVDLRGAAVISRGFEITQRNDSQEAKDFASLCLKIINNSGGIAFVEQWQKNTDLYGNGYVEMVDGDGSKITKLVHVHPYNFGYELEEYTEQGTTKTRIKLDKDTQEPVGYATYTYDNIKGIFKNNKLIDKNRIAHLKYKNVGDGVGYGLSIVQPIYGSILRKLKMEQSIEDTGRLVSSPKIVISGEFSDDEEARREAKEAASLDVSDVVILQNGKDFKIISPGETSLPSLRDIFITNITAGTGIPRPILTSEGNDINKATIQELMKFLRENMRSNMNKIKYIFENEIFRKIGETYEISNYETLIPIFDFPEDMDTEEDIIIREERKAATITSLSNSLQILSNIQNSLGSDINIDGMEDLMSKTVDAYSKTLDTFMVNNDQMIGMIEEDVLIDETNKNKNTELNLYKDLYMNYSIEDEIDTIHQKDVVLRQHYLVHNAFEQIKNGSKVIDSNSQNEISMMTLIEKHNFYVSIMKEHGIDHEDNEIGKELDNIHHKFVE